MEDYRTWQKFDELQSVDELSKLLAESEIPFEIEDTSQRFDVTFVHDGRQKEYRIKLKKSDFERANDLLEKLMEEQLEDVEADYYLLSFTTAELREIIAKRDEWSVFDYVLAQKLLRDRGEGVDTESLKQLKAERLNELAEPEVSHPFWIAVGYISSLFGGLFGIIIGRHLQTHQKTLPNGEKVPAYSSSDIYHGRNIFILGLCMFAVLIIRIIITVGTAD